MVTYSTSALSKEIKRFCNASTSRGYVQHFWLFFFPLYPLCVWVWFVLVFFLCILLETKLPQIFQGTTISGVKKDLLIPCFTNTAIEAFWVPCSTWAEPECSLYLSYQIRFLKGEEVSLIALLKECVRERESKRGSEKERRRRGISEGKESRLQVVKNEPTGETFFLWAVKSF